MRRSPDHVDQTFVAQKKNKKLNANAPKSVHGAGCNYPTAATAATATKAATINTKMY